MVVTSQPEAAEECELASLLNSWKRSLRGLNRSAATIRVYDLAVRRHIDWRRQRGLRLGVHDVTADDVNLFIDDLLNHTTPPIAPKSVHNYVMNLKQFLGWCVDEGEIAANPMARIKGPHVVFQPPVVLADNDLEALLGTCEGRSFQDIRDRAIISVFIATPLRRAEVANLRMEDVDLDRQQLHVTVKGGRQHICPVDGAATRALDRYRRIRRGNAHAALPAFWLGRNGPLHSDSIYRMFKTRAAAAGLGGEIKVHTMRATFASRWLAAGGSEGGLMGVADWRSSAMPRRYAAITARDRAADEYHRLEEQISIRPPKDRK